ncbi:ABC transporter ATP-binding protein [Streptomyces sp. Tu 3180]|uniref:ABC transporter ATP-binding protein n=1 Tax=Streptomyces sp. Tu 3180 TaxID=2682611 RepID=UPI0013596E11|nr:ABC transporter ATP-binding protein [Streptomyces sp. Tu 3180]KAF3467872.1 ATP-binding cassette domain-containing protein [Streptomyces sp. Tu 3180]
MIQAIGLTSSPRKELPPAVDDVSFEAPAGRVTALLGAPGAGKTTVLGLMLELQPGRGITYFKERPLHRIAHPVREVGVLLGDVPGHPARTVRGHLRMLCAAAGVPARRADEVLEAVELVSLRDERLGTLSRGMDRRLGLACALLADPHTLVLDEPAHGLSARERRWLHGMLRAYADQGGTVLYTTADPKEAARTADRVVTLERGKLVADQETGDFSRTRLRPRVAVRSPYAARLSALLAKEARAARRSVEVVPEAGNRLCVYGSTCAEVGETAFRHGIVVHQLADEIGDMGPGAGFADPPRTAGDEAESRTGRPQRATDEPAAPATDEPAVPDADASVTPGADVPVVPVTDAPTALDADVPVLLTADAPSPSVVEAADDRRPAPSPVPRHHADAPADSGSSASAPSGRQAPGAPAAGESHRPASAPAGRPDRAPGTRAELPPPLSVRRLPGPLRPLRYEIRRATGVPTGFLVGAAVLVVSALTAVLLARIGHTPQPRLLAAWPRELPLPPAALGAGLLGALAFGDEFRHPALAADRGTVPRRLGLLVAKLLVASVTALVLAVLTVGCDAGLLYLLHGPEVVEVPADWVPLSAGWLGLVIGCACAGVLAAGVFRSTTAGFAAVVAVPLLVVPLVRKVLEGPSLPTAIGLPTRVREGSPLRWPFGGERRLEAVLRVIAQPVGGALMLSLAVLLCAYLFTTLRSRVR